MFYLSYGYFLRAPYNSNSRELELFSISLEGSSYRESTVHYFISLLTRNSICSNFNLVSMPEPAKGGPIPRFAHDKKDPWDEIQSLPYRWWGNGRLWSPSLHKRIAPSGDKIEGRVISACIRPLPHYMYHLQVYIGLKTQKSYFSDTAERNNNRKYACAPWQD